MNRRVLIAIVALAAVVLVASGVKSFMPQNGQRTVAQIASDYEQGGILSEEDYTKLRQLQDTAQKSGGLSDEDLNWMLALTKRPSSSPGVINSRVFAILEGLPSIPKSQQTQIYSAAVDMLETENPKDSNGLGKIGAAKLLGKLQDKSAIPYLTPLLNDSRTAVKSSAQKALASLGYNAS